MGIQKLTIQGFRSLADITWEPGPLNVIIGPNASGKSNLLRAISLLQKAAQGELPQEILHMGGIAALLWDGQTQEILWSIKTDPTGAGRDATQEALTYELRLRQLGMTSAYRIEYERLADFAQADLGNVPTPKTFLERKPGRAVTFDFQGRQLAAHEGSVPDDQSFLSLVAGPFGNRPVTGFSAALAGWSVYHDLRVDQAAPIRQPAVTRRELRIAPDGQNLISVLHTLYSESSDFKDTLDKSMRAAFGSDYLELVFPPAADQLIQLCIRWRSLRTRQSAANLSDGTLRFLLLCAILANPDPGALIAIDEPEAGLHPNMFPVLAELAMEASERTQVILTTHSPQLLDAFTEHPPTTTVTRWEEGKTELSIVDDEELRRWLTEYSLGALQRSGELEGMV